MFYPLSGALWRIKDCLRTALYVNELEMENSDLYIKNYFMGRMGRASKLGFRQSIIGTLTKEINSNGNDPVSFREEVVFVRSLIRKI